MDNVSYDPAIAWDAKCAREDAAYQALTKGKTCQDCGGSREPHGFENKERIGWCICEGEFICLDDTPNELDCEEYTE